MKTLTILEIEELRRWAARATQAGFDCAPWERIEVEQLLGREQMLTATLVELDEN